MNAIPLNTRMACNAISEWFAFTSVSLRSIFVQKQFLFAWICHLIVFVFARSMHPCCQIRPEWLVDVFLCWDLGNRHFWRIFRAAFAWSVVHNLNNVCNCHSGPSHYVCVRVCSASLRPRIKYSTAAESVWIYLQWKRQVWRSEYMREMWFFRHKFM